MGRGAAASHNSPSFPRRSSTSESAGRDAAKCIWRALMSCLADYRDGLDATAAPGAGPAGSVEQEAADLPLQAGSHLTPLAAAHDPCW